MLFYNLADCFVYPSLYESSGLAQLEAMACGCPVIGANSGAIPEITAGTAMLFDPHSPEDLAQAILTVTQDQNVRRDLIDRALVRVRDFTWNGRRVKRATFSRNLRNRAVYPSPCHHLASRSRKNTRPLTLTVAGAGLGLASGQTNGTFAS